MGTPNYKVEILFCSFCQITNTEPANIVLTTTCYQYCVEVHKTDWAGVFIDLLLSLLSWKVLTELNLLLANRCSDPDFVPLSNIQELIEIVHSLYSSFMRHHVDELLVVMGFLVVLIRPVISSHQLLTVFRSIIVVLLADDNHVLDVWP